MNRVGDALRRVGVGNAVGDDPVQLGYRAVILPAVVGEAVVPENIIFHKGYALTLDGVGNDRRGLVAWVAGIGQGGLEGRVVMAVHRHHVPAKGLPLGAEILQNQGIFAGIQTLHVVVVNDGHQVFQPVVVGEQGSFPDGAFIAFAVSQNRKYPMMLAVLLGGQRHSRRCGKAVAQRAGGKIHPGQVVGDVAGQAAAVGIVGFQLGWVEKSALGQGGVHRRAGVALAHDQTVTAVPVGILGIIV